MEQSPVCPIAVVGIGCRLPGEVEDPETLWKVLAEGRDCWTPTPRERFNESAFIHPYEDFNGAHNHRGGHFLSQDIATFDADFFNISMAEAQAMDPQQRLMLETTYEALESAGIGLDHVNGSNTSVHVAMFTRDYDRNIFKDPSDVPKYHITGSGEAILSNRVSYIFNLHGPSMTIDTGCSGSLVAVHQACQSLRTGETATAIAGGVNLILNPDHMIGMSNLHMLNANGKSYAFDTRGVGYGRGEGVATLVLKRLEDAIQANDPVRAILCNTAVNQDGRTSGITFPNRVAQSDLQRHVFRGTGIKPTEIGYVEAHGTGTLAGDVAELQALAENFAGRDQPLLVGSIKSQIGHLEGSSGLAGLIKAILVLEKGMVPPNARFKTPKNELPLDEMNIRIPRALEPWPLSGTRRACVNSFGYGGTNAHIILQQHLAQTAELRYETSRGSTSQQSKGINLDATTGPSQPQLFLVSARSRTSLSSAAASLHRWVSDRPHGKCLRNLAYTLCSRRSLFEWRYSFVAATNQDILSALSSDKSNQAMVKSYISVKRLFLFTGQGAQWHAMGRELIGPRSRFRESLTASRDILKRLGAAWDLMEELLRDQSDSQLHRGEISQPATTAIQIALVDLLDSVGVRPDAVLGHSSGEIAAAYAAKALDQEAALQVAWHRGFVSVNSRRSSKRRGSMISVGLGEDETLEYISGQKNLCVACSNSLKSTTVSGDEDEILELKSTLDSFSVFNRVLNVDTAYHSPYIQPAAHEYLLSIKGLQHTLPTDSVDFISSVSGQVKTSDFGPAYFVENLTSKVRFLDAVSNVCRKFKNQKAQKLVMVEIGPHSALAGPVRQISQHLLESDERAYYSALNRDRNALHTFLELVGKIAEHGQHIDFEQIRRLDTDNAPRVIPDLPKYHWDHSKKYWYESRLSREYRLRTHPYHDLLGTRITSSTPLEPRWRHVLSVDMIPWLRDHMIDNLTVFPGAGYLCMVIEAVRELRHADTASVPIKIVLKDVTFVKALLIPPSPEKVEMQLSLNRSSEIEQSDDNWLEFRITALSSDSNWNEHCVGLVRFEETRSQTFRSHHDGAETRSRLKSFESRSGEALRVLNSSELYKELRATGNNYGPLFCGTQRLDIIHAAEGYCKVIVPDVASTMPGVHMEPHVVHPSTLDTLMHSSLALYHHMQNHPDTVMPTHIGKMTISSPMPTSCAESLLAKTTLSSRTARTAEAEVVAFGSSRSEHFEPVIEIANLGLRGLGKTDFQMLKSPKIHHKIQWAPDVDFIRLSSLYNTFPFGRKLPRETCFELFDFASTALDQSANQTLTNGFQHAPPTEIEPEFLSHQSPNGKNPSSGPLLTDRCESLLRNKSKKGSHHMCARIAQFTKVFSFKYPRAKVLDVGSKNACVASTILDILHSTSLAALDAYDFTSDSEASLELARSSLTRWKDLVRYQTLDIEQDPIQQGYQSNFYDLVLFNPSDHCHSNFELALRNVSNLLIPGGTILIVDASENFRSPNLNHSPMNGDKQYASSVHASVKDMLWGSGFDDVQLSAEKSADSRPAYTFLTAKTRVATTTDQTRRVQFIQSANESERLAGLTCGLQQDLASSGFSVSSTSWSAVHVELDTIYVVFDHGPHSILSTFDQQTYDNFLSLMKSGSMVMWINVLGWDTDNHNAEKALIKGFARSAHAENEALRLVTVDVQPSYNQPLDSQSHHICAILARSFETADCNVMQQEREFVVQDGQVLIPRILRNQSLNDWVSAATGKAKPALERFSSSFRPLKLSLDHQNASEGPIFVPDTASEEPLGPGEVEVDTKAHGVDLESLSTLQDGEESPNILSEWSGVVHSIGSRISNLRPGDRVCGWGGSPIAARTRVRYDNVFLLPGSISYALGASLPFAYASAYHCLMNVARLGKRGKILVYAASGPTGQAMISIAQSMGLDVFAVVDTSEEIEQIMHLDVPRKRICLDQTLGSQNFSETFTLVVNNSPRDFWQNLSDLVAPYGTMVDVESKQRKRPNRVKVSPLRNNIMYTRIDISTIQRDHSGLAAELMSGVMQLIENRRLKLEHALRIQPLSAISKFLQAPQTSSHFGKVVLENDETSSVWCLDTLPKTISALDPNATYVIAGGLGDLGRKICRLMAERGARHIVVLSRKDPGSGIGLALEGELHSISSDFRLYQRKCDIAKQSSVRDLALNLEEKNVPPIKGIIQATVVLRDRTLDTMTFGDFQIPVRSKLYGTLNLSQVFSSTKLDFFLLLSSTTGIGSRGQANYAAANTFLDAFANHHRSGVSLAVGLIQDAEVNDKAIVENLTRHGLVPVQQNELLALIEYAISPQAQKENCHQIISGFDGASLGQVTISNAATQTRMFGHIRNPVDQSEQLQARTIRPFIEEISDIKNVEKIKNTVAVAIASRINETVSGSQRDINLEASMTDLGLDSLITIELRNWISREFKANISTSEILDQPSIRGLATRVTSASKIVQDSLVRDSTEKAHTRQNQQTKPQASTESNHSGDGTLQPLPLPELSTTLHQLRESRRAFVTDEEFSRLSKLVERFGKEGGPGCKLHERLIARSRDASLSNWQEAIYAEPIYLERREPAYPCTVFYGGHLVRDDISHTQARRAAIIAGAAFLFSQRLDNGTLESDFLNEEPLCMSSYHCLLNTCREPIEGGDRVRKYAGNDYCVVLRRGHLFKVLLKTPDGLSVPIAELEKAFQLITVSSRDRLPPVAALTTDYRDSWAKIRRDIATSKKENQSTIEIVESAAFAICLDDESPSTPSERCNQFFLSNPGNRWADKILQFIVCNNGVSAFVCEHSVVDGLSIRPLNQLITQAIMKDGAIDGLTAPASDTNHTSDKTQSHEKQLLNETILTELTISTDVSIKNHINRVTASFASGIAPIELTHYNVHAFGDTFLRQHHCSPKTAYQLVIQLACLFFYEYQPASWETVSMARFKHGRVDWIQVVSPAVAEFCRKARDESISLKERQNLFYEAVGAHNNSMARISRGHGFVAHLYALLAMARQFGEELPELYNDPQWEATSIPSLKCVKTDSVEGLMLQETAFLMPEQQCVYVHYEVEDENCLFFVQTWPGLSAKFCNQLEEAAGTIKRILEQR